jgi:hypothetical protein
MLHKFSKGTTAGSSYKGYVLFGPVVLKMKNKIFVLILSIPDVGYSRNEKSTSPMPGASIFHIWAS